MSTGEPAASLALFEQCLGVSPEQRAASVALTAADQYPFMLAYFSAALTYLGSLTRDAPDGMRQSRWRDEPGMLTRWPVHCLGQQAAIGNCVAGLTGEAKRLSEEVVVLTNEHGFPVWEGVGKIILGWALTELTTAHEGLAVTTEGLSIFRGTGMDYYCGLWLRLHAEVHARLGSRIEALTCLDEAQRFVETMDERRDEAELNRLRGDLLVSTGDWGAAEQCYYQALAIARRQSVKLFELRAAISLARFWHDQGKRSEALDLLAPVYNWFTEGFDTPVLKEAEALLDALGIDDGSTCTYSAK